MVSGGDNDVVDQRIQPYTVRALDESTWDAFAELVERNNGVFGGSWCMGHQGLRPELAHDHP